MEEQAFSRIIAQSIGMLEKYRRQYLNVRMEEFHVKGVMFPLILFVNRFPHSSQDDLVEFLGIDKSGVARKCRRLADLGYLQREPLPGNRRQYRLSLTGAGQGLLPVIIGHLENWNQIITEGMSVAQQKEIAFHLEKMAENAGKKYC